MPKGVYTRKSDRPVEDAPSEAIVGDGPYVVEKPSALDRVKRAVSDALTTERPPEVTSEMPDGLIWGSTKNERWMLNSDREWEQA